jgi:protein arginine N-methyltransferase 1
VYDIGDFGKMLADDVRTPAYEEALRRVVAPGCTVLEIGTGTGYFAMLAKKLGAARVYAVEPLDAIELAREIAAANDLADGIEFIRGISTEVSLPHKVDVLVSDLRGSLPLFGTHLPSVMDARDRLLDPGGMQVPLQDTIRGAVVESHSLYEGLVAPWRRERFDLDQDEARSIVLNTWHRWWPRPELLLTVPQDWAILDYTAIASPHLSGHLSWSVSRAGTAHGLVLWFDTLLADGIGYSNAPEAPDLVYGSAFFPFPEPIEVAPDDQVRSEIRADLIGSQYTWTWRTRVMPSSTATQERFFEQSTFFALPMGPRDLATQAADHRPRLAGDGRMRLSALELMDGEHCLDEIAGEICRRFPARFTATEDALRVVRGLSREYSAWDAA